MSFFDSMRNFSNIQLKHIISLNSKMKKIERHSPEWFQRRLSSFGGSEMSKVLCEKPCWKESKMTNTSNEFCLWGLMFEEIAIEYVLKKLPGISFAFSETLFDTRLPISYSPDGFLYDDKYLYLVEIKCPFYRSIYLEIKPEYFSQVQTGMYICNVKTCKFFQFDFVVCGRSDMLANKVFYFNRYAHHRKYKNLHKRPVMKGIFLFKENDEVKGEVDVGTDIKLLNKLDTKNKIVIIKDVDDNDIPETFGCPYLCWKLLDYNIQDVERIPDYITSREDDIWKEFKILVEQ